MKVRRFFRDALLAGAGFICLQAFQAVLLRDALDQQNQQLVYRLGMSVAGVLNKAHQSKDDLTIYETISALAQGPGVVQACIIGPDDKIIAHKQPSRLREVSGTAPRPNAG